MGEQVIGYTPTEILALPVITAEMPKVRTNNIEESVLREKLNTAATTFLPPDATPALKAILNIAKNKLIY